MPERQAANRMHARVYVCVEGDRVNLDLIVCTIDTIGMQVCDNSIIRGSDGLMARLYVCGCACT